MRNRYRYLPTYRPANRGNCPPTLYKHIVTITLCGQEKAPMLILLVYYLLHDSQFLYDLKYFLGTYTYLGSLILCEHRVWAARWVVGTSASHGSYKRGP